MRKTCKLTSFLITVIILMMFISVNLASAYVHSSTSAHTSYKGLSMTGYQGWFGTPGDGGTDNWRHYNGSNGFQPGSASIEYWPDMREADEDEKYPTSFVKSDGTPCYVFSSVHPKTVARHFQWMKEYGIDGAFMQRFRSDFGARSTMNKILANALAAARQHDRAIALMYDIGANIHVDGVPNDAKRTEEVNRIFDDWKNLIDELYLTTGGNDQPYLYHNGKPLIVLWGVGFSHRHNETGLDMQYWVELVDSLQNNQQYGGCSIMLGVPTYWKNGGGDCVTSDEHDKLIDLINRIDIIQPWHTSRFSKSQMKTTFKNLVASDLAWCKENGVDYTPTISPGIREKILHGNNYEQYREGGYYFWEMAKAAVQAGSEMLYLGMFDEVDEGTQYHKIDNNPPFFSEKVDFATYGNDPQDHYLWLAGEATRAMRGEFIMGAIFRQRANADSWQSDIEFTKSGDMLAMYISTDAAGRKVYYADPYKVPDGAPTIGTLRDADLFKNELSGSAVEFDESVRGMYIRFVEVDAATDTIIAFRADAPFVAAAKAPYNSGFEDGILDSRYWNSDTDSNGRITVSKDGEPYNGKYHLTLDAAENGTDATAAALLHLDLSNVITRLDLNFYCKNFASVENEKNAICFSDDNGDTWIPVFNLNSITADYQLYSLYINELAAANGLQLNDAFVIKFQYSGNSTMPNGGFAFDNVSVSLNTEKSGFAQFLTFDTVTQGTWTASYGYDGRVICGKQSDLPEYAQFNWDADCKTVVWQDSSSDVRGLIYDQQNPDSSRILAACYADSVDHPWTFSFDVGDSTRNISLYFLDGNAQDTQFTLRIIDASNGDVYDVQTVKDFQNGLWGTWNVRGKVIFVLQALQGPSALVSGIFFDPATPVEMSVEHYLTFDGVDDFVDCGRGESIQMTGNAVTLEAWFKADSAKEETWQSTLIAMDHGETDNDVGYFLRANGNGQVEWGFGDGNWHEVKTQDGIQYFESGKWTHVAGVYDGSLQKIYVNGNLLAVSDSAFTTELKSTPEENLWLAGSPSWSNRVFRGSIAEVRIWNIARTDQQIKKYSFERISGEEEGLAAYWPIDEGEGQIIADKSGNENIGVLGGSENEDSYDPLWTEGKPLVKYVNVLQDYNGGFEQGLEFWRFFEVPERIGSTAEIIQGDVVEGANAVKVAFVEPQEGLADRALDNWDSNMALEENLEYIATFSAKTEIADSAKLNVTYGFFDDNRNVIAEGGVWFDLITDYKKYDFSFISAEGTKTGWLSFRWKDQDDGSFPAGVVYLDDVQLLKEEIDTGVKESVAIADEFTLQQNYPNPFNPSTTIRFSVPEASHVKLCIYNVMGQQVKVLLDNQVNAGARQIVWNGTDHSGLPVPSGLYIYRLTSEFGTESKKMLLIH